MVWVISYRHSLRPEEAGIKFVRTEAEIPAERARLEARGYLVTEVDQSPLPHATAD